VNLNIGEEWLRRMSKLEDGHVVSAGGLWHAPGAPGGPDATCLVQTGSGCSVVYVENGVRKTRRFGSRRRAKRFSRHLARCRRVGDGPTWGAPVDVRVSAEQPRWRR